MTITLTLAPRGRGHASDYQTPARNPIPAGGYGSRDAVIGPVSGNARASAIAAQPVPAAEIH